MNNDQLFLLAITLPLLMAATFSSISNFIFAFKRKKDFKFALRVAIDTFSMNEYEFDHKYWIEQEEENKESIKENDR